MNRPSLAGIHHLKFAVSDLDVSLDWWERAFGGQRQPHWDHTFPDGRLFAYMLLVPGVDAPVELRLAPGSALVAGFDSIVFAVETREDLEGWAKHLADVGIDNSGVLRGFLGWLLVAREPDGNSLRLYTNETHDWDVEGADVHNPWVASLERDRL
ncbi:catechol 2,3-dioxygenase-like lactoylglutathione lyase family enzyme [Branchiibius hedensis]|uniref:Catechol 2,3-dioxygenase n=1 Tax=Branchiibius hedensis TaxID=672460 RepID=A0A2Y8ZU71_9MICO|nr:VOC family protein [Branchiibius hedensis]PWJ25024.1 catechol 2,3-dioxygenase-like lactoylglutathione lyase family enzyme [Branchiibius hedensis]SSA33839.1 Catechol 2,3-dioxygenase [Branchiibius hedensis]